MALKKNDFIEINFTGKTNDGTVFDSTIKEDLENINKERERKIEPKPFIFPLGQGMFMEAIDKFLIGKPEPKEGKEDVYEISLEPEKAFGKRNSDLIQMMPMKTFREHGLNPVKGASFNFDGRPGKIITVSGGRVIVDFNHVLAGKAVEYKIQVLRKLDKMEEKVKSLNQFFFRKEVPFEIKDKKLILDLDSLEPQFKQVAIMFKDKYNEILGTDVEIKGAEDSKKDKKEEDEGKKDESDKKSQ